MIKAAERAIAAHGLAGLRARDLARETGVALGAIYNLVEDLDELTLRVASRTLARFDAALAASATGAITTRAEAIERLVAIARAYRLFASQNLNLWRALFEHRTPKPTPEWAKADQLALFRHVVTPLEPLTPQMNVEQRLLFARSFFAAVHGVVLLGLDEKFIGAPIALLDAEVERIVRLVCAGLSHQ
ncbi:MAG: WHG domain-containing protein [Hyphomicrobiales bacterium]|nr:WHG domain-containing protein [Hyphomicrobiales bacterium]